MCVGLLFGGRLVKGRSRPAPPPRGAVARDDRRARRPRRRRCSATASCSPSLADIAIPFVSGYKRLWTTRRDRRGLGDDRPRPLLLRARTASARQRWRKLHRFTALAWVAGLVHSLGEGTDAGAAWFLVATAIVVVPAFVLLIVRHLGTPSTPTPAPGPSGGRTMSETIDTFACFGSTCAVVVDGGGDHVAAQEAVATARRLLLDWHDALQPLHPDQRALAPQRRPARRRCPCSTAHGPLRRGRRGRGGADRRARRRDAPARDRGRRLPPRSRRPLPLAAGAAARAARAVRRARAATRAGGASRSTARRGSSAGRRASRSTAAGWPRACSPTCSRSALDGTRRSRSSAPATCASAAPPASSAPVAVAEPVRRRRPAHVRARGRRRRDERHRPPQLARRPPARPAHHLLDPATGRPAFTGVVQATALAPTALEAEIRAKAAVLGGPDGARAVAPRTAA